MISITVKFPLKPEYADDWPAISRSFTEATRAEPGNKWFEWARLVDDPTTYLLTEAFDDDAAAAHVGSDHFAQMREEFPQYLRMTPFIVSRQVTGDGWDRMGELMVDQLVVSASREVDAPADVLFELLADPSQGRDADDGGGAGRVRRVGDVRLTREGDGVRTDHVVELEEGRRLAWADGPRPGHLWRWELEALDATRTRVTHTYDWSALTDEARIQAARSVGETDLPAAIDRLAARAGA